MGVFTKHKNLILFIIIAVLIIGGYFVYMAKFSKEESAPVSSRAVNDEIVVDENSEQVGSEILSLLLRMNSIELNPEIFSRKSFKSLKDNSKKITPEPVGRSNPFSSFQE